MRLIVPVALGFAAAAATACSSSPRSAETGPVVDASAGVGVLASTARWTGNIAPTHSFSGGIQGATRQNTYGTVALSMASGNTNATRVQLTFQAPIQNSTSYRWALLPGRCGSGSIPLLAPELFPPLEMSSTGRGQLDSEIPLNLPISGSHHVNIYSRGSQLSDVIGCANLRYEAR